VRIDDLRFSVDEAGEYFNNLMQLGLNDTDVCALETRTEGWIAGLHLAAMSIQGHNDIHKFVQDFTGNQYLVLEYLVDEVLKLQHEPVQRLLLETSILQRICAPLCDAVTGSVESERTLTELYRQNLFIIPLDGEHYWFRYHHLFAEFLKSQLKRLRSRDLPELHRRASVWFEKHGYLEESLFHAMAIPDYPYVCRLVVDNWRRIYHTGNLETAVKWLESIPDDILRMFPPLLVAYCWTLFIRGDHARIGTILDDIELVFNQKVDAEELPKGHPEYQIIMHQVILLRVIVMRHEGNTAATVKMIEDLLPKIEELRYTLGQKYADMGLTACYSQLGYSYAEVNKLDRAEEYLSRVGFHARGCGNYFALAHATMEWVRINILKKRLDRAEEICRYELLLAEQSGIAEYPAFCLIFLALADTLQARGSWESSEKFLGKGLEIAKKSGHKLYLARGFLIAARLHHAIGKTSLVHEDMCQAELIAASIQNRFLTDTFRKTREEIYGTMQSNDSHLSQQLIEPLSDRELEVLRLICQGKSNQEIADELFVALNTIKRHTNNIFGKMGVNRRTQAIFEARRLGLG
jgi:LuxR family transcriptional regulator, maltose regulon positive regulatory protein